MSRRIAATGRQKRAGDEHDATRRRVLDAARALLAEGRFQTATMEEIAEAAGLSRAGLYLHFRSRGALIDAICETLDDSTELRALHDLVANGDPRESLLRILEVNTRFWVLNEPMLQQLYGSVAIDDAARDFVIRQTQDRSMGLSILTQRLSDSGQLRDGLGPGGALPIILVITSFPTYLELRRTAGLSEKAVVGTLQSIAANQVLARDP